MIVCACGFEYTDELLNEKIGVAFGPVIVECSCGRKMKVGRSATGGFLRMRTSPPSNVATKHQWITTRIKKDWLQGRRDFSENPEHWSVQALYRPPIAPGDVLSIHSDKMQHDILDFYAREILLDGIVKYIDNKKQEGEK
jgi:hypothetical protein